MQTSIFKVVSQTETVNITRQDGTQTQKSTVVLADLNGSKYPDTFAATLLGNQVKFYPNELVVANLRFSSREYNGNNYQDITINEIYKLVLSSVEGLTSNEPF